MNLIFMSTFYGNMYIAQYISIYFYTYFLLLFHVSLLLFNASLNIHLTQLYTAKWIIKSCVTKTKTADKSFQVGVAIIMVSGES